MDVDQASTGPLYCKHPVRSSSSLRESVFGEGYCLSKNDILRRSRQQEDDAGEGRKEVGVDVP